MNNRIWTLGAPDPEMEMIERLLRDCGETVVYATMPDGQRVRPETAYRCPVPEVPEGATVYAVECIDVLPDGWIRIDHHRPGDPGYGRPPEEFLPASSLGQVIAELARLGRLPPAPRQVGGISSSIMDDGWDRGLPSWVPWQRGQLSAGTPGQWVLRGYRGLWAVAEAAEYPRHHRAVYVPTDIILAAAADHCLGAAYRGECPGVDPDALMRWRAASRAAFQRRSVDDVLADVERAREALRTAPTLDLDNGVPCSRHHPATPGRNARWHDVDCDSQSPCRLPLTARDLRGQHVPELPEASAREGECFVADGLPGPDGRVKVVCQSGTPAQIEAFMRAWAPAHGLTDIYGDPARGFAGGYMPAAG